MEYTSYGYHGAKHLTTPKKTTGNIKGVELEINDEDCGYIIDRLIDEGFITVPETETSSRNGLIITCEEDGSVYRELVLKASCNRTLLKAFKKLNKEFHGNIYNGESTSCHIHINNAHMRSRGINRLDFLKASEFFAPILFSISGRDEVAVHEWARSTIEDSICIDDLDLYKRSKLVDELTDPYFGRYFIVNTNPTNSTELRIFSNSYSFDYDYLKMYIETCDFLLDISEYMHGKSYEEEYDTIIELGKTFFGKRKYKRIANRHNLKKFFLNAKERRLEAYKEALEITKQKMNMLKVRDYTDYTEKAMSMLRALRYINSKVSFNINFNINDFRIEDIENEIINTINEKIEELNQEE